MQHPPPYPQRLLSGEPMEVMAPWYRGFKGAVEEIPSKTGGKSYSISGIITQVGAGVGGVTKGGPWTTALWSQSIGSGLN
jgi:hypothetical protein